MKAIVNRTWNGKEEVIARIVTNRSMTLDEAIQLVGTIHNENTDENVEIDGEWYYYDDLEYKEVDDEDLQFQFEASPEGNILWAENGEIRIKATVKVPDGASEDYGYLTMKRAIQKVLKEKGLTASFWYDGQEKFLDADVLDGAAEIDVEEE